MIVATGTSSLRPALLGHHATRAGKIDLRIVLRQVRRHSSMAASSSVAS